MSAPGLFDVGLQLERTTLSWRRTGLAVAVGSLVSLRLLPEYLGGAAWIVPGLVGLAGALWMWATSRRRHERFMARIARGRTPRVDGGAPLCAIAAATSLVGVFGVVLLLLGG
jgi:putative membrane protein